MKVAWQTYGPLVKNQAAIVLGNGWVRHGLRNLLGGAAFGFGLVVAAAITILLLP